MNHRLISLTLLLILAFTTLAPAAAHSALSTQHSALAASSDPFASSAIQRVWQQADGGVASGAAGHSWVWGPGAFLTTYEAAATDSGNHLVQYFDKGRLEVNDPSADPNSQWYVTSGLLVKEMVSGRLQGSEGEEQRSPANIAVVGSDGPSYAAFVKLTGAVGARSGAVLDTIDHSGQVRLMMSQPDNPALASYAHFDAESGHNIASPFWQLAADNDPLLRPGWLFVLGHPISEPYWTNLTVAGQTRQVLVQMFERRALTFTPSNSATFQVEFANVGRAYYQWRYHDTATREEKTTAQYTNYVATVNIAANRTVQVRETATYTNSTGLTLNKLVVRVVPHHYKGAFTLNEVIVGDGIVVETRWRDEVNLELTLPQPLTAGQRARFVITFSITPPPSSGRFGYSKASDVLTLGDWLPAFMPYENGGWLQYPYANAGDEGVNPVANYRIIYTADSAIVVAATGNPTQVSDKEWQYDAAGVRDVAATISPRLLNPLQDSSLRRKVGDVTLYGFFLPEHLVGGRRGFAEAAAVFTWYNANIGTYPYYSYVISEMAETAGKCGNYSQEFPMIAMLNAGLLSRAPAPRTWDEWEPQHEVAHAWFYGAVGSDQLREPWLDEAVATSVNLEYLRTRDSADFAAANKVMTNGVRPYPVSASTFSFPRADDCLLDTDYYFTVYSGGTRMLDEIRAAMGGDAYRAALRDYFTTFTFKRARPADFITTLKRHTAANLQPILDKYLAAY